ncbi:MAG: glycerol-3-phosphate 1-O-acyltransferase PlsY [Firmicutes bacterium]|nr:glycerol-3-phosphate 1-O-acyltransferase PlsY [Bacillota bacterium]
MFYVFIVIAYLLGSISPSIIQGRLAGVDIKKEGSGNAGTTNTLRVLGKKAALITLIIDICKAVLAVFLGSTQGDLCSYICAVAVFAGHIWPVYFGFKGGKGVATAFGAILMVNWKLALIALAIAAVLTIVTKRMSVGSIFAALGMAVLSVFMEKGFWPYAAVIAIVIIIKHRANIKRLLSGTEPPISFKKK